MQVQHIAAFSIDGEGGNPAGVVICEQFPSDADMQETAAAVGYSETVFLHSLGQNRWRVRYFMPVGEVSFCGHATIALGYALTEKYGSNNYELHLNDAEIDILTSKVKNEFRATVASPPTDSQPISKSRLEEILTACDWTAEILDENNLPAIASTVQSHPVIFLKKRAVLSEMKIDEELINQIMAKNNDATIMFAHAETPTKFNVRNFFFSGSLIEDPATGSAAAAFAGLLRRRNWAAESKIEIYQGEDMGMPSRIIATIPEKIGSGAFIEGQARILSNS